MPKKIRFSDIAHSSQRVPNFLKFILFVEHSPHFEAIKSNGVNSDFFVPKLFLKYLLERLFLPFKKYISK